ncbi:hypothetical protein CDAR_382101 [Caerostris darwini]|uniref:Uncharacterized protein n=1 Tax=Caerostris darwini TaxID=1538125 RepID=A0AAV4WN03_9ARAC|nr:hypothetical protein CDAR_382101 [Caerostris darwini]
MTMIPMPPLQNLSPPINVVPVPLNKGFPNRNDKRLNQSVLNRRPSQMHKCIQILITSFTPRGFTILRTTIPTLENGILVPDTSEEGGGKNGMHTHNVTFVIL